MAKTLVLVFVGLSFTIGCASAAPQKAVAAHTHNASDHNHDRGQMMIASNGLVEALLTAHLSSKTGNELDVFVEKSGSPLALTTTELHAVAHVGTEAKQIDVACAPAEERPKDERDGCSHFVARAEWLRPGQAIRVETELPLRRAAYVWRGFEAIRYAHHVE